MELCQRGGIAALLMPQYWLFKSSYEDIRRKTLQELEWNLVARLGPGAFETISGEVVNVCLGIWTNETPEPEQSVCVLDVDRAVGTDEKKASLELARLMITNQLGQLDNPQSKIIADKVSELPLLEAVAIAPQGVKTGDVERWRRFFWERYRIEGGWIRYQTTVRNHTPHGGRTLILDWRNNGAGMVRPRFNNLAVNRRGIAISQSGDLPATIYTGERFDSNVAPIIPEDETLVPALWAFCTSDDYHNSVRMIDKSLKVTNVPLIQIPFDESHWRTVAKERGDIPRPYSFLITYESKLPNRLNLLYFN